MSLRVMTQGGGTGGESASIFVKGLSETDVVTASKNGKTITAKWESVESRFEITKIKEYGMWTVTATNGEKTATQVVLVDAAVEYEIEMVYYTYLYDLGDECEDVTGGWKIHSSGKNNGTLTKNDESFTATYAYGNGHAMVVGPSNVVDVTNFTKLVADLSVSNNGGNVRLAITTDPTKGDTNLSLQNAINTTSFDGELGLDLSGASGNMYIVFTLYETSATVNKVWLE